MANKKDSEITKQKIINTGRNEAYRILMEAIKNGKKDTIKATLNVINYMAINILAQRALNMVEYENRSLPKAIMLVKNEIENECKFLEKAFKPKHFEF